jgi:toxin ParE1/3/4
MPIIWSPESLDDPQALRIHIAVDDRAAASRMVMRIVDAVESVLAPHPDAGRPGRVPGTREFVVARSPYIVPYQRASCLTGRGHSLPSPLRGRWPFAAAKGRMGVVQTMALGPEPPPSVTASPRHLPRKGEGQGGRQSVKPAKVKRDAPWYQTHCCASGLVVDRMLATGCGVRKISKMV